MATYEPISTQTPLSGRVSPRTHLGNPTTPVHSPHHSVTSSISSRTPIHTLTIHEYRRQQNTPVANQATPPGKTLRRKNAAVTLANTQRAPSASLSRPRFDSGSSLHTLKFSQSAQQLHTLSVSGSHEHPQNVNFRSQSAGPGVQGNGVSNPSSTNSGKLRNFSTRKRLPHPSVTLGSVSSPAPPQNLNPPQAYRLVASPALSLSTENLHQSAETTPTPSTFSFTRFPEPPQSIDPTLSPLYNDTGVSRAGPLNLSTTAPATPPATPAIIHYRGTSFDLVNPHDSLLFHDIITPSKDFDSTDYLPLRTSEEPLEMPREVSMLSHLNLKTDNN